MILSDRDILADVGYAFDIVPFRSDQVQPSSYDLTLAYRFRRYTTGTYEPLDPRSDDPEMQLVECQGINEPFILEPGHFVLGATRERVRLGPGIVARLEGKSSLGRLGVLVHSTAGFIDPGFEGTITLELFNLAPQPIMLFPEMKIAQLSFQRLSSEAEAPYGSEGLGSKYQGQIDPTISRYRDNYGDLTDHG